MLPLKAEKAFWITNTSDRNVTLSDLNISVPARSSINLLDTRHYHLTETQVKTSAAKGSIFIKRDKIVVRKVPPVIKGQKSISFNNTISIPGRTKSIYEIHQEDYAELQIGDIPETDDQDKLN
jgi:hypothetical protein